MFIIMTDIKNTPEVCVVKIPRAFKGGGLSLMRKDSSRFLGLYLFVYFYS